MSKRSSSPHGLDDITPDELRVYYDLKPKKLTWSQLFRFSKAPDNDEYDEDDLEKARKDLATPEKRADLLRILEKRDHAADQNLRDLLKKEKADQAIAAATELRSQQQQIADRQPIRPADPEEVVRTEFFGNPLYKRELNSFGIGRGVHNFFTNPKGRGGKSKRVKSRRVKSKRNKHRNTRK